MKMRILISMAALAALALGASKVRDWKQGRLTDVRTYGRTSGGGTMPGLPGVHGAVNTRRVDI